MIWTIFTTLVSAWILGIATSNTMGGYIHILLGIAVTVLFIRVIQGRRIIS